MLYILNSIRTKNVDAIELIGISRNEKFILKILNYMISHLIVLSNILLHLLLDIIYTHRKHAYTYLHK